MQTIQGSFACLQMPLPIIDTRGCANLIETCIQLSNGQSGEHLWADQATGSGVEVSFTHR